MIVLYIIIWLAGSGVSYIFTKRQLTKNGDDWTVGDQIKDIIFSFIFSWLFVLVVFIVFAAENDKPAKW